MSEEKVKRTIKKEGAPRTRTKKIVAEKIEEKTVKQKEERKQIKNSLLAVVRIRGNVNVERSIRNTLKILRLHKTNHCIIVPKNPTFEGMLKEAAYYITWGDISSQMLEKMVYKRGRYVGDKRVEKKDAKNVAKKIIDGNKDIGLKPIFRLSPPSGGYRATRFPYPKGDLGYRGDKINELLKRMI